jgi:CYTH domain-containing protein
VPIENERKYVIDETSEMIFAQHAEKTFHIEQKYLAINKGFSTRVRSINNCRYILTVKQDVQGMIGQLEIETDISKEDFDILWKTAYRVVSKVRYVYKGWEIDFFKNEQGKNYIAVAEIELPPKIKWPETIPLIIKENILYVVPIEDKRFSNKKIGNVKYASKLLEHVKHAYKKIRG